jgi:D-alanyl-D-alanine carboxypeptidase (penicillin-binding protein 5/6)
VLCATLLLPVVASAAATPATQAFDVAAGSAILVDASTGQELFSKNADLQLPPASMVKIMTMLLVMEEIDSGRAKLTDKVTVSARSSTTGGSQVYLKEGESFTVEEMLKAVAIHSANDASVALAEHFSGAVEAFVDAMNRRAKELGLEKTVFTNPDGLPPEKGQDPTLSSARELSIMARELIKHPKILEWTTIQNMIFREQPKTILYNTNKLVGKYQGLDGLKTGHTDEAGWCLTATAKRGDVRLVSVVMKTKSESERSTQTARLLDYGFRSFVPVPLVAAGVKVGTLKIKEGSPGAVDVNAKGALQPLVARGAEKNLTKELVLQQNVKPPLKAGDTVGAVVAKLNGKEIARTDAVVARDVKRANFIIRFFRWIKGLITGLFD